MRRTVQDAGSRAFLQRAAVPCAWPCTCLMPMLTMHLPFPLPSCKTDRLEPYGEAVAVLDFARAEASKRARHLKHPQLCLDAIQTGVERGGQAGLVRVCTVGLMHGCEGQCHATSRANESFPAVCLSCSSCTACTDDDRDLCIWISCAALWLCAVSPQCIVNALVKVKRSCCALCCCPAGGSGVC